MSCCWGLLASLCLVHIFPHHAVVPPNQLRQASNVVLVSPHYADVCRAEKTQRRSGMEVT